VAPSQIKPLRCIKGYGFHRGIKPLERRVKAVTVLAKSAGAEASRWKHRSIATKEQSFEGRSPGVLETENVSQGSSNANARRKGSQTLVRAHLAPRKRRLSAWAGNAKAKNGRMRPKML
jgi:hypothetical protein